MDQINQRKYNLISRTQEYQNNLAEAISAVQQAIKTCKNPAVSFSFGKDSLVCMDITRRIKPDILVINVDRGFGGDVPEAVDTFKEYLDKNNVNLKRVKTPKTLFELYHQMGNLRNYKKSIVTNNLLAGIKKAVSENGIDCSIIGLRADESIGRRHLKSKGFFYFVESEQIFHCCPILNWTSGQVWAYIISNNLPYLKWYDYEACFDGYENIRYSNWAGLFMYETGRVIRLKKAYPELYNKFASEFPEVHEFC